MDGPTPVRTQEVLIGLHESRKEKEKDRGICWGWGAGIQEESGYDQAIPCTRIRSSKKKEKNILLTSSGPAKQRRASSMVIREYTHIDPPFT